MKIRNCMALICAVVALSACGRTVIMREGNSSEGTSSAVIEPVAVGKKTAKEKIDLSGLSHDKVGYGQGVLVDDKNRTSCKLCLRIKIFYSLRHKVRSCVPESFLTSL